MKDKPIPSPTLWLFKPDEFDARVEFQFTTPGGELLRSQTWVLHHGQLDPLTTYLLQARAQLATPQPDLREAGQNYYILTTKVFNLEGELHTAVIRGGDKELLVLELAKFPLSFAIAVDHLVVARLGTDAELMGWLRSAGLAACENTAVAAAMLVLTPSAPKGLLDLWLATVRCSNQSADAYTTVYWSRHTWPLLDWFLLKSVLKPICIADQKAGWFNWFAHLLRLA